MRIGGVKDTTKVTNVVFQVPQNDQMYNISGQKVDQNFRGVVIRGGKKYIQK